MINKLCIWWLKRQGYSVRKFTNHVTPVLDILKRVNPAYDPFEDEEKKLKGEVESYFD